MAKRNLARTTRKHGRFVEDLMMRYFEQKVCDFAVMVLHTNRKNMERLIPKAKEIPKSVNHHYMSCLTVASLSFGMMLLASGAHVGKSWVITNNSSIHSYQVQSKTTG
jgi:hypothetical protein